MTETDTSDIASETDPDRSSGSDPEDTDQEEEDTDNRNPDAPDDEDDLDVTLYWIGFRDSKERRAIYRELGGTIESLLRFTESDITSLEKSMSGRNKRERIYFGLARTKYLKSMLYWAKDFERVGEEISVANLSSGSKFREQLLEAESRQDIRTQMVRVAETRAKEATPGKLRSERQWNNWEQALSTQLGILLGVSGIPLSYIIREKDTADADETYESFFEKCVARAPLFGPAYEADALQVHQLIRSYTVGENAEQWIRELSKHKDGRKDMAALRAHYRGAGNQTRQISTAEQLLATLHYKDERQMAFSEYISKVKEMFNIYLECNEEFTEARKLRFLWSSIRAQSLQPAIESLKAQIAVDPSSWTFITAADHLAAQVTPASKGRQLSAVHNEGKVSHKGIPLEANGSLKLYDFSAEQWASFSRSVKQAIFAERKKRPRKEKESSKPNKRFKDLARTVRQQGRKIASLTGKKADENPSDSDDTNGGDNAGNSFGGREGKKGSKPKSKST